jgi:hypothetical protein
MAGGIATASAVAGIYDVLVGTVHDGSRYGAVLGDAIRVHRRDTDRVLGAEVSRGLGFRVGDPGNLQTFGHPRVRAARWRGAASTYVIGTQ